jgi:hypothetical protein
MTNDVPIFVVGDDDEDSGPAKCLIFGPSGHGKTRFLGTANDDVRTYPILILDYEGGLTSLKGRKPPVDAWSIRSWEDFNKAYEYLNKGDHPYKSIGLDSISEAHVMALMLRLTTTDRRRPIADQLDENDYGIALVQMRKLIRKFRDLPYHFFCTALSKEESDVREGVVKKAALSGKFADEVVGIFRSSVSYMAQTDVGEGESKRTLPVLILGGYPKIKTKLRLTFSSPTPPNEIVDPTIGQLLDVLGY